MPEAIGTAVIILLGFIAIWLLIHALTRPPNL